jgi:hypothetical protein
MTSRVWLVLVTLAIGLMVACSSTSSPIGVDGSSDAPVAMTSG